MMHLHKRFTRAVVAAGALALVLAGCAPSNSPSDSSQNLKIVVVSGPLSDPFFSAMKKGAEQAGQDLGATVQYTAPNDLKNLGPDLARLGDAALSAQPDAVVVSEFLPDAQDPGLKSIVAAGVPLVFMNAGPNWETLGGLTYVGEDPNIVGSQAGDQLMAAGAKNVLCVNHVPGNPTLESRCEGLKDKITAAGGNSTVLNIPADQASNPTSVTTAISGALRADPSIEAVFTLGSGVAENAVRAAESAGSDAIIATTDLSKNVLDLVKAGDIAFALDQQPYLQGYYTVLAAIQAVRLGVHPIGQVGTSPLIITRENVDETIRVNDENAGLRGAA